MNLEDFSPEESERSRQLTDSFRRAAERTATFVVRAPGRVNLLGEHTDYNGLPVLPMAIDRSTLIAGATRADRIVQLSNTAAEFPPRQFEVAESIQPYADGDWGNYSKAAAQGVSRHCGTQIRHGADLLIDGTIPRGAGLSSSSSLVVASALALLAANEVDLPPAELAQLLAVGERYVGTFSGGMDQAVSLLASAGQALRIDFFPLKVRAVPLPPGCSIVVCHSLVQAEKSGAAKLGYNLRVVECRLACRVLERSFGSRLPHGLHLLGDLTKYFPGRPALDFLSHLTARVPERPLALSEIATAIGTSPERLRRDCEVAPALGDRFALVRRVRHVLSEAERVNQAEEALRAGDAAAFGRLMDASHASCRDDYDISCNDIEELIRIAKEAGAMGARLTGAGFGGCTVNLVHDRDVPGFLTRVDRYFYRPRFDPSVRTSDTRLGDCRFVFRPRGGARIVRL